MPNDVAAAFGVIGQTTFGMVRQAALTSESHVLITGGTSSTSLAAISAFTAAGAEVTVATTSQHARNTLDSLGASEVVIVSDGSLSNSRAQEIAQRLGGFDVVIDPFADIFALDAVRLIKANGTYITCGIGRQTGAAEERKLNLIDPVALFACVITRRLRLVGTSLGTTQDLCRAIQEYSASRFTVLVDSTFGSSDLGAFVRKSFGPRHERLGKTVFKYVD